MCYCTWKLSVKKEDPNSRLACLAIEAVIPETSGKGRGKYREPEMSKHNFCTNKKKHKIARWW